MMKHTPFGLNEARQLAEQLQHLVGVPFDPTLPGMDNIECIAVAPFDNQNKKQFLLYYLLSDSAENALEEYDGILYDVVVIARMKDNIADLMQYDINTWLQKNNLAMSDVLSYNKVKNGYH